MPECGLVLYFIPGKSYLLPLSDLKIQAHSDVVRPGLALQRTSGANFGFHTGTWHDVSMQLIYPGWRNCLGWQQNDAVLGSVALAPGSVARQVPLEPRIADPQPQPERAQDIERSFVTKKSFP